MFCHFFFKNFKWSFPVKTFSGSVVDSFDNVLKEMGGDVFENGALWDVSSDKAVAVLYLSFLVGAVGGAEVGGARELFMVFTLYSAVKGNREEWGLVLPCLSLECLHKSCRALVLCFCCKEKSTFSIYHGDERCFVSSARADGICFHVPHSLALVDFLWSMANPHSVRNHFLCPSPFLVLLLSPVDSSSAAVEVSFESMPKAGVDIGIDGSVGDAGLSCPPLLVVPPL